MEETLSPCPFCGAEAEIVRNGSGSYFVRCADKQCAAKTRLYHENENGARLAWNRRAERTWHDFSYELPPGGVSVLCRGKNGALYVGKPVTFKGNGTRKVWVPRGDQYRTPEKWMEVSA